MFKTEEEWLVMSVEKNQREIFPREEPRKSGGRKPRRMFKMAE